MYSYWNQIVFHLLRLLWVLRDMDIFDDPSEDVTDSPAKRMRPVLQQRASSHPHFTCCNSLWPPLSGAPVVLGRRTLLTDDATVGSLIAACCKELRHRTSTYGKACAAALKGSQAAYAAGDAAGTQSEALACTDYCALQLEEATWDHRCWQEANLFGLAFTLAELLDRLALSGVRRHETGANADEQVQDATEQVGQVAIALFNLAVTMCCNQLPDEPLECIPLVSGLLGEVGLYVIWTPLAANALLTFHMPPSQGISAHNAFAASALRALGGWHRVAGVPSLRCPAHHPTHGVRAPDCTGDGVRSCPRQCRQLWRQFRGGKEDV